jgi:hypothetical protein
MVNIHSLTFIPIPPKTQWAVFYRPVPLDWWGLENMAVLVCTAGKFGFGSLCHMGSVAHVGSENFCLLDPFNVKNIIAQK